MTLATLRANAYKIAWIRTLPRPDPVFTADVVPGFSLPYLFDAAFYLDGSMPDPWIGAAYSVVSHVATNTPTTGSELLTDPGLEANYTAGLCDTLIKSGAPTLAQSADVHGGAKAQQFTGTANNDELAWSTLLTPVAPAWYKFSAYGKRTAGAAGTVALKLYQGGGVPDETSLSYQFDDATYQQRVIVKRANNANQWRPPLAWQGAAGPFDTVVLDDASCKMLTDASLFALLDAGESDLIVKLQMGGTYAKGDILGVVSRADTTADPSTFLIAYYYFYGSSTYTYACLDKCVAGVYANLIKVLANNVPDNTQWLEIRTDGSTVQLWRNNAQVGTDQTVTDVPITNTKVGIFSTGGMTTRRFWAGTSLTDLNMAAWGDSLTDQTNGWAENVKRWAIEDYPQYNVSWNNQARGGNWTWSNLVRCGANLLSSDRKLVLCDFRPPSQTDNRELAAGEALLRRIWTANPTARIISPSFPSTLDGVTVAPLGADEIAGNALAAYYGVVPIHYRQAVIDKVADGELLSTYMLDNIHPTVAGHILCASLVEAYFAAQGDVFPSGDDHSVLPARVYDNGDYECTPTILTGISYTSRTGAGWTDTGTRTESATAGDTITYTATCKSFGLYSAGTVNTLGDVSIDGAAWELARDISHNGYDRSIAKGAHAITIRVRAGAAIRIDEFWAI